jgi:hypothetical protein
MNFEAAVQYLLSLGHETLTIKLGLRNTELLLAALDHAERAFPSDLSYCAHQVWSLHVTSSRFHHRTYQGRRGIDHA